MVNQYNPRKIRDEILLGNTLYEYGTPKKIKIHQYKT